MDEFVLNNEYGGVEGYIDHGVMRLTVDDTFRASQVYLTRDDARALAEFLMAYTDSKN